MKQRNHEAMKTGNRTPAEGFFQRKLGRYNGRNFHYARNYVEESGDPESKSKVATGFQDLFLWTKTDAKRISKLEHEIEKAPTAHLETLLEQQYEHNSVLEQQYEHNLT